MGVWTVRERREVLFGQRINAAHHNGASGPVGSSESSINRRYAVEPGDTVFWENSKMGLCRAVVRAPCHVKRLPQNRQLPSLGRGFAPERFIGSEVNVGLGNNHADAITGQCDTARS